MNREEERKEIEQMSQIERLENQVLLISDIIENLYYLFSSLQISNIAISSSDGDYRKLGDQMDKNYMYASVARQLKEDKPNE